MTFFKKLVFFFFSHEKYQVGGKNKISLFKDTQIQIHEISFLDLKKP